jgi:hypothetical protein
MWVEDEIAALEESRNPLFEDLEDRSENPRTPEST